MHTSTYLLLVFVFPALCYSQAKTAEELRSDGYRKYNRERAKITYEISGDAEGAEIMVFDNFGWSSMRKQTMVFELYGIKTIQTLLEIHDGNHVYNLNQGDSTMVVKEDYKWSQYSPDKNPLDISQAILFSMGGTYLTDSTLLGKKCQVWAFENKAIQELWVWEGLTLKRKLRLGQQMIYTTAKNIQTDYKKEMNLFRIPDYVKKK